MPGTADLKVIIKTITGKEAETILAQAEGYRRMSALLLDGTADRNAAQFIANCKGINREQSEKGA